MKNKHMSLEDRQAIEEGLKNNMSRTQIAKTIGKDISTVSKEIKLRRIFKKRNIFNADSICIHLKDCKGCKKKCDRYEEQQCKIRDKKLVCNSCDKMSHCHLDKYFYRAKSAHEDYLYTLTDSRVGLNLNTTQVKELASILKPLLDQGQSLHQIKTNHPEIEPCQKSLYTYIEAGVFKDYGIDNFSLRKQVSRRPRKKLKSRKEPANYTGRKYKDYLEFVKENPTTPTTEMDTVYNSKSGPYIQTFIFQNTSLMIGFLHKEKTSKSMSSTLTSLQDALGNDYSKLFSILLTDRGVEFEKYKEFEINMETGESRSKIFYCDPQMPSQKPHVEVNHNFVRDILPNKRDLSKLTQEDLNLMFSHINSVPRLSLGNKTPYEVFSFLYGEDILEKLNIQKIEKDMVTLQPYLLKI